MTVGVAVTVGVGVAMSVGVGVGVGVAVTVGVGDVVPVGVGLIDGGGVGPTTRLSLLEEHAESANTPTMINEAEKPRAANISFNI